MYNANKCIDDKLICKRFLCIGFYNIFQICERASPGYVEKEIITRDSISSFQQKYIMRPMKEEWIHNFSYPQ